MATAGRTSHLGFQPVQKAPIFVASSGFIGGIPVYVEFASIHPVEERVQEEGLMWTIAAVAIGRATLDLTFPPSATTLARQYIQGLIDGLNALDTNPASKYRLGTDYQIEYHERTRVDLNNNPAGAFTGGDVIFGMSSTVVRVAKNYTAPMANPTPIVGIVSDHVGELFDQSTNICGFSALRHQTADQCFRSFVNSVTSNFTTVVLLHKAGYNPSDQALVRIAIEAANAPRINLVLLPVNDDPTQIAAALNGLPTQPPNTGILVLPADTFFAKGNDIIALAQNTGLTTSGQKLPTFFFATDWVRPNPAPSALGAYGVPQHGCGVKLAERVVYVRNNTVPLPAGTRWTTANTAFTTNGGDFKWQVSRHVAAAFGFTPNTSISPTPPDKIP